MSLTRPCSNDGANNSIKLGLRNLSGIPVLDVFGEIDAATARAIEDMASGLLNAGHNQIVLNFQKAAAVNTMVTRSLMKLGREVKKHYGRVTLVTGLEPISQKVSGELKAFFSFAISEADALLKIKRVMNFADAQHQGTPARLAD
jgi:anti-anti-sigma regulatory factor